MACRQLGGNDELIRLVCDPEGKVIVDFRGRLPGRGAWIHPRRDCFDRMARGPKGVARQLGGTLDPKRLEAELRQRIQAALLDGLSMAAASGSLVGGHDVLHAALLDRRISAVVVADGASARTIRSLKSAADPSVPFVTVPMQRDTLGGRIGRGSRAALGVLGTSASSYLLRQLHWLRELG